LEGGIHVKIIITPHYPYRAMMLYVHFTRTAMKRVVPQLF
jgi:hypothetical protein